MGLTHVVSITQDGGDEVEGVGAEGMGGGERRGEGREGKERGEGERYLSLSLPPFLRFYRSVSAPELARVCFRVSLCCGENVFVLTATFVCHGVLISFSFSCVFFIVVFFWGEGERMSIWFCFVWVIDFHFVNTM